MVRRFMMVGGGRVLQVGRIAAVIVAGIVPLAACADCFFTVGGRVVECGTTTPLSGVTVSVHIDEGIHGPRTIPMTFTTDGAGRFQAHTDGTEVCDAVATLTFAKDGFVEAEVRFDGSNGRAEICLLRGGQ